VSKESNVTSNLTSILYAATITKTEFAVILTDYNKHIKYDQFCNLLYRAVIAKELIPVSTSYDYSTPIEERNFEFNTNKSICWATSKGFNLPLQTQQKDILKKDKQSKTPAIQKKEGETPPYLNPNHPNFAFELMVAIELWMNLFSDETRIESTMSVRKRTVKALENMGIEPTNESVSTRLATIITPDHMKPKKGSAMPLIIKDKPTKG
jgi:hypothetical protein